ncbi:MAG: cytochrome c-type biogenesis protein CcmF [Saprospiraceae bacterium]|jgi:cytochrome c-type biogenesis protein CcmF
MEYIGEHLLPGQIGRFLIVFSFVCSILASVAYFFGTQRRSLPEANSWRNIGRTAYSLHGISIISVIGIIFYVMTQRYYEYQYVWAHVNEDLAYRYLASAFWEGQEGSFLLWMFWHVILGWVLIRKAKEWESPVMSIVAAAQVLIGSMILGLHFGAGEWEFKIGSNPLLFLRDTMQAPIFANADYLSLIKGTGLNPLLQNYWMTIHPPTLFLGFASTIVPFAFAVAGYWTGQYKAWLKPVMPWALFSGAILGTGILMGGAWAYEALSFGGYWAWDPVENMSLVPWLFLIGGIHTNLVARNTGYSIRTTYLFYGLSFVFILYSTFLTRSGVLGETSVHAFTEMGLEYQLIALMVFFLAITLYQFFKHYKKVPEPAKEEGTPTKEFWMFIGSLVLFFSAILITVSTSLPVFNKIAGFFDPTFDAVTIKDQVAHHNKYQLWIAILIGTLSGFAQFLRFNERNWKSQIAKFSKHAGGALLIAGVLTYLTTLWLTIVAWQHLLLMLTAIFTVVSNLDYIITFLKGNLKLASSSFSHIGFGLMIVGAIASGLNKQHISSNRFAQKDLLEESLLDKNILLFKNMPMYMSGYRVTYSNDTMIGNERIFSIDYEQMDEDGNVVDEFSVKPVALYNNQLTKVAAFNPSTKHYLGKDIFTHIANLPIVEADIEARHNMEDSLQFESYKTLIGDTIFTEKYFAIVEEVSRNPTHPEYEKQEKDIVIGIKMVFKKIGFENGWPAEPMLLLRNNLVYNFPTQINDLGVRVQLPEEIFARVFDIDQKLSYKELTFKEGDEVNFNGAKVIFQGFNTEPEKPEYVKEEGDIAVGAKLNIQDTQGKPWYAEPIYLIRGNQPFNLKDQVEELGLHFKFLEINPNDKTVKIGIAQAEKEDQLIPVEITEDALRSDYVVLEAIVFPGINFFWLGSIMMMLGMLSSMFYRRKQT